jgi:hypothetical protein
MVNHEFIDPDLIPYYRGSCLIDPESAGCRYFKTRYSVNVDEINPYNVYSYCFYNDSFAESVKEGETKRKHNSQAGILRNLAANKGVFAAGNNGAPCAFFDGMVDYFNAHISNYHATPGVMWNGPCVSIC